MSENVTENDTPIAEAAAGAGDVPDNTAPETVPPLAVQPDPEEFIHDNVTIDTAKIQLAENAQHTYDQFTKWVQGNVPGFDLTEFDDAQAALVAAITGA